MIVFHPMRVPRDESWSRAMGSGTCGPWTAFQIAIQERTQTDDAR